ncbi:30S ribosomal protein S17 [Syncephalis plumigaleata]|nr:30S ribosomal protein S17 [Syncephalis plumigaleata]
MRQNFVGMVIGTAMQKTVKVRVAKMSMHPVVKKMITKHKTYFAHDENETCRLGDVIRIEACRPLSKKKHFAVAEVVQAAKRWQDPDTQEWKQ